MNTLIKKSKSAKGTILVVGSSAEFLLTKDGKKEHVGYYLNELVVPIQAALDDGYEMVLATPKGDKPVVDWQSKSAAHFGGSEEALAKALNFVDTYPAMQKPYSLRSVIDAGLEDYAAVYLAGGHPPMVDLMQDPELGEILRYFHTAGKVTALLCHGPIAIAAAIPKSKEFRAAMVNGDMEAAKKAAEGWQYKGYNMTIFSNDEEHFAEENYMGGSKVPFYVAEALKTAGGIVKIVDGGIFKPHVVEDRELITGQNPPSDQLMAETLVKALNRQYETYKIVL
ncbi:Molecular chaperone Hsp31 and glyoxalase 3 [compost metagenome]